MSAFFRVRTSRPSAFAADFLLARRLRTATLPAMTRSRHAIGSHLPLVWLLWWLWPPAPTAGATDPPSTAFRCSRDATTGWLTSLRCAADPDGPEFLRAGQSLGAVTLRVRPPAGAWKELGTDSDDIEVHSLLRAEGPKLRWTIRIANRSPQPLEIGDLALPLPMNTDYVWDREETYRRRVFRHAFIGGHASFLYWIPLQGTGPILVMLPEADTHLEYFTAEGMDYAYGKERFRVYIHSQASSGIDPRGTWRQPQSHRLLAPNEAATYAFAFHWAENHEAVRALLLQEGSVDVHVAPGMVVPRDQTACLNLRTRHAIRKVEAEFAADTDIAPLDGPGADDHLMRLTLRHPGENRLTVHYADGRTLPLEFFVTQPLETLIKKRAAFIVRNQQHRAPDRWYDGLYSLWDRRQPEGRNLLGPDHPGGQHPYAVSGSDDPSNGKCLLVSEKNVAFPDAAEIASLETFVKHFVWGRQQRTDAETPYPYGIYGSDSWLQNRGSTRDPIESGISRPGGPSGCRLWRSFDYPTYFALYFNLYRIARQRPDLVRELDAAGYLDRAWGTARAYFDVPANIRMEGGWSHTGYVYWQYTTGNFHEKYLLPLIAALEDEGRKDRADALRAEWEKKVKYFLYDEPWPFTSEMPVDSTAYESTYAIARYALEHPLLPDTNLWQDRNTNRRFSHPVLDPQRARQFCERQHQANLACRGVLEPAYWAYGSDFRGCGSASYTLSYMTPMGGWAVLDYALRHDPNPAANLRLGQASMLGAWALMNAGDPASNYGYWTPGPLHDGAMSWGFQPRRIGTEWNPATAHLPRGAWPVCGEADHGLVAAIEAARTVVFDDPMFGWIAYGGQLFTDSSILSVVPLDGVRQRLSVLSKSGRLHIGLDRDGFAARQPIKLAPALSRIQFTLESRSPAAHTTRLTAEGLPPGPYTVAIDGRNPQRFSAAARQPTVLSLEIPDRPSATVEISPSSETHPR